MRLLSLDLLGFKSFAKKTSFSFSAPVVAIVGPNGSGKSNVAEAFRFVLGEQSMKSLRGKKGEDLIFNGGLRESTGNRASVTVVFDNHDKSLPYDFDEVAITRTVFRDGINEYRLNGSVVRLRDVLELMSTVGLGSSGHHIISQGEADKLLNSNPKDRREIIEDALGLKIYQWKIDEANRKLNQTEINIREVGLLRREITPHLKFLANQVEQIESTINLRRELKLLYFEYLFREEEYLKRREIEIIDQKKRPQAELIKIKDQLASVSEVLSTPTEKLRRKKEIVDKFKQELIKCRSEKDNLSRQLGRLEGMMTARTEIKQTHLDNQVAISWAKVNDLKEKFKNLITNFDQLNSLADLKQKLDLLLELFNQTLGQSTDMSNSDQELNLIKLNQDVLLINNQLAKIELQEAKLLSEEALARGDLEAENKRLQNAERHLYEWRAKQSEVESELKSLQYEETLWQEAKERFLAEIEEGVILVDIELRDYRRLLKDQLDLNETREKQIWRLKNIEKLKLKLEDSGVPNEGVVEEHKELKDRNEYLIKELADLEQSAKALKQIGADLEQKIATEFASGLNKINKEFSNYFTLMFGGGTARLETVVLPNRDGSEEVNKGIDIVVNLPRKKIKNLNMMSGGERALTSIALLFALSQVNPPPFLILDETDAALDEANSKKYGDMIENLATESQLIVITHNRETMSRAGVLYGVTMGGDSTSRLLSIKFEEAASFAK